MDFLKVVLPNQIQCKDELRLKAVFLEDAESFLTVITENQKHFSRFEFIAPTFETLQEIQDVIQSLCIHKTSYSGASYGLWNEEFLLGLFTINQIDWANRTADIGFWLTETSTGKGFARIALKSLINCCSGVLNLNVLTAHTAVSNIRSQSVLEKAGFNRKNLLKDHIHVRGKSVDEFLYTLVMPK